MMDLQNKKIAILGFGIEGESVVRFAKTQHPAQIALFSEKEVIEQNRETVKNLKDEGIPLVLGPFPDLSAFDVIVRSPSIRPDIPALLNANKKGSSVTSATKLFFDRCPCPIIGVTGTKGKGTTSALLYEMLKAQEQDVYLGGNIGTPPLDFLPQLTAQSVVVLELSSFQLWDLDASPHIGVLVMTTIEHLDVHINEDEYIDAKSHLFSNQKDGDFAVMNWDYPNAEKISRSVHVPLYKTSIHSEYRPGCYVKEDKIVYHNGITEEPIITVSNIFIPGKHNWQNVCSAVCAAKLAEVSTHTIRNVLMTFVGLVHRLEFVADIGDVKYYDDSFSTTPETAIAAIEAFPMPKVLILGGSGKNSDFTELGKRISESTNIRAIIGIGEEWEKIKCKMQSPKCKIIEGCKNMKEIVEKASEIAQKGDVVLLSPACASFGMFKNYKDRGNQFKEQVHNLSSRT